MKAFLAALGEAFVGDLQRRLLSDGEMLRKHGLPTVEDYLVSARVKGFSRLVVNASESVRTLLTSLSSVSGTYSAAIMSDLAVVGKFKKLSNLPAFAVDPHAWTDLMRSHGRDFADIIEQWLASRIVSGDQVQSFVDSGEVPAVLVGCLADPYIPFLCADCGLSFCSKQARGRHRRRVHRHRLALRSAVWGSLCPSCGIQFGTRARLLQHMAYDQPLCGQLLMESEPLLLLAEVVQSLDARDAAVSKANRRIGLPERFAAVPAI